LLHQPKKLLNGWWNNKFNKFPYPPGLYVKNTTAVLEKLEGATITVDESSFEVPALFANVPVDIALTLLKK
jgi:hypothetical protein